MEDEPLLSGLKLLVAVDVCYYQNRGPWGNERGLGLR